MNSWVMVHFSSAKSSRNLKLQSSHLFDALDHSEASENYCLSCVMASRISSVKGVVEMEMASLKFALGVLFNFHSNIAWESHERSKPNHMTKS